MKDFTKIFFLIELLSIIFTIGIAKTVIVKVLPQVPPDGLTACSQYPKTPVSRKNAIFKNRPCFIQYMFRGDPPPNNTFKYKCAYANITDGHAPYLEALFPGNKTRIKNLYSQGSSTITVYVTDPKTKKCVPKTDKYAYGEYVPGRAFTYTLQPGSKTNTLKLDRTIISTMVIANENGYGIISCVLDFKNQAKCNYVYAAFVCTFDPNASTTHINELWGKFDQFPLYNRPFMTKVNQTDADCSGCRPNSPK